MRLEVIYWTATENWGEFKLTETQQEREKHSYWLLQSHGKLTTFLVQTAQNICIKIEILRSKIEEKSLAVKMTYCTTFKNINALFNPTETAPPATVDVIYPSNYINEIK